MKIEEKQKHLIVLHETKYSVLDASVTMFYLQMASCSAMRTYECSNVSLGHVAKSFCLDSETVSRKDCCARRKRFPRSVPNRSRGLQYEEIKQGGLQNFFFPGQKIGKKLQKYKT